jgi:hypothetical protein
LLLLLSSSLTIPRSSSSPVSPSQRILAYNVAYLLPNCKQKIAGWLGSSALGPLGFRSGEALTWRVIRAVRV